MGIPTPPETSRPDGYSGRPATRAAAGRRSDRADLVTALGVGIAAAGVIVVLLIVRLVEVFGGGRITVPVAFAPTDVALPVSGTGAADTASVVSASVDGGTVSVADLPAATLVSVVLAELVPALAALVVIACAVVVLRRLLAGDPFARGTARLISISSFAILAGWMATSVFGTLASNGALAVAAGGADVAGDSFALHVSWLPLLAAMGVGALAIAFRSGERLQVDSDGLV